MHINELLSLKGQTALVIGGAGKIGFPIVEALAEAGAHVFIGSTSHYEEAVKKLRTQNLKVDGIKIDQRSETSLQEAREAIHQAGHKISILVNSGVMRPMTKYMESSADEWSLSMDANAKGLFLACRMFAKDMLEIGHGRIINIASIYGVVAPDLSIYQDVDFETEPDYPYTKGGMVMYTKYLASYYAKNKITANCIAPGGFFNNQPKEFLNRYLAKVPMNRMAYHDDLKAIATFLASPGSSYITGQVIALDGGLTIV